MTRRAGASFSFAALLLAGLVACGGEVPARDPLLGEGRALEPVVFTDDGLAPVLSIPASDGASVALWARSEPGTCFTIVSLEDAHGRAWVRGREAGAFCTTCEVRASVARTEGLFVLPETGGFAPGDGLAVRFGLVRCDTLTPLATSASQSLEVSWSARPVPAHGRLAVRLLVTEHAVLVDGPEALIARLDDELAEVGIEVTLAGVVALEGAPDELRFSEVELDALEALLADAPPPLPATVDVVLAGCLRYDDPFFGAPSVADGFTPRVGGGAGPASAVFVRARGCDGVASPRGSLEAQAHVLAHELGHFLGLHHTVELDGTTDLLSDTDEHNTMHHNPSLASARGWSPTQGAHLRSHPWVRP